MFENGKMLFRKKENSLTEKYGHTSNQYVMLFYLKAYQHMHR